MPSYRNMKVVLGLDLSLRSPGLCVLSLDGSLTYLVGFQSAKSARQGTWTYMDGPHQVRITAHPPLPKAQPRWESIRRIREVVAALLQEFTVVRAVVENYAYGVKDSSSVTQLGEVNGVIRLLLYEQHIPFQAAPPQTIKLYLAGHGHADKTNMIHAFQALLPPSIPSDVGLGGSMDRGPLNDMVDAFGLALWGVHENRTLHTKA
jgi:Holliday junction resolvasome RuvABC endonuclease subunit